MRVHSLCNTGLLAGATLVGLLCAARARAADDPDPCVPFCTAATLHFCDGTDEMALACSDVDAAARCGELSAEWGADCLLPEGAACDPGYAFGASRCDAAAGLFCVEQTCTPADGPGDEEILSPTPGSESIDTSTATSGCGATGCSQSGAALWAVVLVPLLLRRKRS